ncbi:het domain protein [Rhypophila decipiens]
MKPSYLLSLAPCACALEHLVSYQSPLSQNPSCCLWRLPPPQLACGLDELDITRSSRAAGGGKENGNQTGGSRQIPNNDKTSSRLPSPPKWEGPKECLQQFCIYYNHGFANGRGIVAITTAPNLSRLEAVEQALNKTKSSPTSSSEPQSFTLAEVKGKGLGLLASRPLTRSSPVMAKTPALLIHRSFLEGLPPSSEQQSLLDTAASYLPSALQKEFWSQMGHFGGHKILDIMATNSFQMNLDPKGQDQSAHHYGNYPEVSRFNHDCRPNVAFYIDKTTLRHTTTVVRPVEEGGELTISYLDVTRARVERQSRAKMAWGFECSCKQCALPAPLAKRSDERLEEIARMEKKLSDIYDKEVTPQLLERLVNMYEEERLQTKLASPYTLIALNYNMLGEDRMAKKYARLAYEALVIEHGETDAGDLEAMLGLERDPKGHFTWRARLKMKK